MEGLTNRMKEFTVYMLTSKELAHKYLFHTEEFLYLVVKMLLNYVSIKFWYCLLRFDLFRFYI
jgi:hypothetical protein